MRLIHFEWYSSILSGPVFPLNGRLETNTNIQNLNYGYEKISSAYSPSPIGTLFFIKNYMLLWSVGSFVSLLKHVLLLSLPNSNISAHKRTRQWKAIIIYSCNFVLIIKTDVEFHFPHIHLILVEKGNFFFSCFIFKTTKQFLPFFPFIFFTRKPQLWLHP